MIRLASFFLFFLLLAGCSEIRLGRDNPQPSPGWVGQPVADFAARNPAARQVYEQDSLYIFELRPGYGKCEIFLKTDGEVISEVVNLCAPGTLWLSPPLHRATAR